jgi:hypothetical protein
MADISQVPFQQNEVDSWIEREKAMRNISDKQLISDLRVRQLGLYIGNVYNENIEKIITKLRERIAQNNDNQMALDGGRKRRKTRKSKKSKRKTHKRMVNKH